MNSLSLPVEKHRVLVVDDMPETVEVLVETLQLKGFDVIPAYDPKTALRLALNEPPDIILLDIMMPEMNGYEVCRTLKKYRSTRDVPVIFVTALGQVRDVVEGFSSGGADYITKPYRMPEVSSRIQNQLRIRRVQQRLEQENQKLTTEIKQLQAQVRQQSLKERGLQAVNSELYLLAMIDSLTQIPNRRRFDMYLLRLWRQLMVEEMSLSLLFCDLDNFKQINDQFGHLVGDQYLHYIAQLINEGLPDGALAARYGGDEFAVVLPGLSAVEAGQFVEALQARVQKRPFSPATNQLPLQITVSIGTATTVPTADQTLEAFIDRADRDLYRRKG